MKQGATERDLEELFELARQAGKPTARQCAELANGLAVLEAGTGPVALRDPASADGLESALLGAQAPSAGIRQTASAISFKGGALAGMGVLSSLVLGWAAASIWQQQPFEAESKGSASTTAVVLEVPPAQPSERPSNVGRGELSTAPPAAVGGAAALHQQATAARRAQTGKSAHWPADECSSPRASASCSGRTLAQRPVIRSEQGTRTSDEHRSRGPRRGRQSPVTPSPPTVDVEPTTGSPLVAEIRALQPVEAALRAGRPHHALQLLNRVHVSRLVEHASALRVIATCQTGRATAGRRLAARFHRDTPESPFGHRVDSACLTPESKRDQR